MHGRGWTQTRAGGAAPSLRDGLRLSIFPCRVHAHSLCAAAAASISHSFFFSPLRAHGKKRRKKRWERHTVRAGEGADTPLRNILSCCCSAIHCGTSHAISVLYSHVSLGYTEHGLKAHDDAFLVSNKSNYDKEIVILLNQRDHRFAFFQVQ